MSRKSFKDVERTRPRTENAAEALRLLEGLEEAATREDLPFVVSAIELVRDAVERGLI
jgi:hypothetical protein